MFKQSDPFVHFMQYARSLYNMLNVGFAKKETLLQTSQPQKTKNLEIKVKKPGDLGRNLEIYRQHQKELKPGVGKT